MYLLVHTQPLILLLLVSVSALVIIYAGVTAKWKPLFQVPIRLHLFFALSLILGVFWSFIAIPVNDVLLIHPSLMVSATLIFGFRLSLLFGALALVVSHLVTGFYWENIGFHFISGVCAPVFVTFCVFKLVQKIKLQILFFYTLGVGFVGGMLSMVAVGSVALALLWLFDSTLYWPAFDHFYLFFLLAFPEGFCNGVVVSTLAVFRPDLIKTFDDDFYLK